MEDLQDPLIEHETLLEDYEVCGTCGFDHSYDADYPGVYEKIQLAHQNDL